MNAHGGVHHVPFAGNGGQHPMGGGLDQQLEGEGGYYHDDEGPHMDGRGMMGPFGRPNGLGQFPGQGRMQPQFDFMQQQ